MHPDPEGRSDAEGDAGSSSEIGSDANGELREERFVLLQRLS